jgi:hypothetical protein
MPVTAITLWSMRGIVAPGRGNLPAGRRNLLPARSAALRKGAVTASAAVAEGSSGTTRIELSIQGMTCAACAARVEKKLNSLDDVHPTVNFATECC